MEFAKVHVRIQKCDGQQGFKARTSQHSSSKLSQTCQGAFPKPASLTVAMVDDDIDKEI